MKHILLFVAIFGVASCFGQSKSFNPSGTDWRNWNESERQGYVIGFTMAMDREGSTKMLDCMMILKYLDSTKVDPEKWKNLMCLGNKESAMTGSPLASSLTG